jgi:hypothetical protein
VLGEYAATAPFDCPKSKRIFELGCEAIAKQGLKDPKGNIRVCIENDMNALALLASPLATGLAGCAPRYTAVDEAPLADAPAEIALTPADPEFSPYPTFNPDPELRGWRRGDHTERNHSGVRGRERRGGDADGDRDGRCCGGSP